MVFGHCGTTKIALSMICLPARVWYARLTHDIFKVAMIAQYRSIRRLATLAVLICNLMFLAVMSASALAKRPDDWAASRRYLRADYTLVSRVGRRLPAERVAAATFVGTIRRRCAKVAAGSAAGRYSTEISTEVLNAVSVVMLKPDRSAVAHFVNAVKSLRWNNETLTRIVAAYVRRLKAEIHLRVPDLCADMRAWAATDFGRIPDRIRRFNRQNEAASLGPKAVPDQLLALYSSPTELGILDRIRRLENQIEAAELNTGLGAWLQIVHTVELHF
jgi:hypothetical protein